MKILDCTIRDGGYYTNWDFSPEIIETYFEAMNNLPIEYLEVGYRSPKLSGYHGEFYYCPEFVMEKMAKLSNKKLVLILNEKDISLDIVEELLKPCQGLITMIRLAIDPNNFERAVGLAKKVKSMGFELGFNVMYMSKWKQIPEFLNNLKLAEGIADYFYMVDSYGGVYPEDVKEIYNLVRSQITTKIGFHGHNNLELGLINSLTAMECGADIIDATVTGMGRGAGNLKTELLLTALNERTDLAIDFDALSEVTDAFVQLQNHHQWGTNLPYMVSGANSLPQKEVMEWVSKRYYSINSIVRALHNQKDKSDTTYPNFEPDGSCDIAIIIGGGPSANAKAKAILELLKQEGKKVAFIHASSKNSLIYADAEGTHYYCLAGNEGNRLTKIFAGQKSFNGKCILPPSPRLMGTFVPDHLINNASELDKVEFTDLLNDSHTAIALQVAFKLNMKKCYIVGYDGYTNDQVGTKEQELFIENDTLFADAKSKELDVIALTPTRYNNVVEDSIYSNFQK